MHFIFVSIIQLLISHNLEKKSLKYIKEVCPLNRKIQSKNSNIRILCALHMVGTPNFLYKYKINWLICYFFRLEYIKRKIIKEKHKHVRINEQSFLHTFAKLHWIIFFLAICVCMHKKNLNIQKQKMSKKERRIKIAWNFWKFFFFLVVEEVYIKILKGNALKMVSTFWTFVFFFIILLFVGCFDFRKNALKRIAVEYFKLDKLYKAFKKFK